MDRVKALFLELEAIDYVMSGRLTFTNYKLDAPNGDMDVYHVRADQIRKELHSLGIFL